MRKFCVFCKARKAIFNTQEAAPRLHLTDTAFSLNNVLSESFVSWNGIKLNFLLHVDEIII